MRPSSTNADEWAAWLSEIATPWPDSISFIAVQIAEALEAVPSIAFRDAVKNAHRLLKADCPGAASDVLRNALRAVSDAASPSPWRSMESAPKDGTVMLAYWHDIRATGKADFTDGMWWSGGGVTTTPSCWMPLPSPPSEGELAQPITASRSPATKPTDA